MGGEQSKTDNTRTEKIIQKPNHPKLLHAELVYENGKSQPYLQTDTAIADQYLFKKWVQKIQDYKEPKNCVQTIYLPKSISFERKGMCGSSGNATAKYQAFSLILKQEVQSRNILERPFEQKQIWYLLYILCSAGAYLHDKNLLIGDIRPENILLSVEGQIQIIAIPTFIDQDTNFRKTLTLTQITYLSPEQIKDLQEGKNENMNPKNQCFSIGLTILSAILLTDQSKLYSQDFSFNKKQFDKQINQLSNSTKYHPLIKKITKSLLSMNQENRATCMEIVSLLKPFEQQIMNMGQFHIEQSDVGLELRDKMQNFKPASQSHRGSYTKIINNGFNPKSSTVEKSPKDSHIFQHKESVYSEHVLIPSLMSTPNENKFQPIPYKQNAIFTIPHTRNAQQNIHYEEKKFLTSQNPRPKSNFTYHPPIQSHQLPHFVPPVPSQQVRNLVPQPIQKTSGILRSDNVREVNSISNGFLPQNSSLISDAPYFSQSNSTYLDRRNENNEEAVKELASMGRKANSIHPTSNSRDNVFNNYDKIMSKIDDQLSKSQRQFPEMM